MLDQDQLFTKEHLSAQDHLFDPAKHAELIQQIKQLALQNPDALKEHARGAFAGKEGDELIRQVADSRTTVNNVKAAFVTIGATLAVIDAKKLSLGGKPVPEFTPKWEEISTSFDDTMRLSQKVAARAAQTAQQFSDVLIQVLLDPTTTKSDAHDVLDRYKSEVHEEQTAAEEIGTKLTNLHKSINNFSATLVSVFDGADKDSSIVTEIENVRKSIATINERITQLESLINGCMWSAIGGGIGMFAGVLLTLTPLAPVGVALIVGSVGSAAGAGIAAEMWGRQLYTAKEDRKKEQGKLDALLQTQKDLVEVQARLGKLDGEWATISSGLAAISAIWGAFSSSLISIEKSLSDADKDLKKDGEIWQKVYLLDLKLLESIYARLGQMLSQWAANITAVYEPNGPAPPYNP